MSYPMKIKNVLQEINKTAHGFCILCGQRVNTRVHSYDFILNRKILIIFSILLNP